MRASASVRAVCSAARSVSSWCGGAFGFELGDAGLGLGAGGVLGGAFGFEFAQAALGLLAGFVLGGAAGLEVAGDGFDPTAGGLLGGGHGLELADAALGLGPAGALGGVLCLELTQAGLGRFAGGLHGGDLSLELPGPALSLLAGVGCGLLAGGARGGGLRLPLTSVDLGVLADLALGGSLGLELAGPGLGLLAGRTFGRLAGLEVAEEGFGAVAGLALGGALGFERPHAAVRQLPGPALGVESGLEGRHLRTGAGRPVRGGGELVADRAFLVEHRPGPGELGRQLRAGRALGLEDAEGLVELGGQGHTGGALPVELTPGLRDAADLGLPGGLLAIERGPGLGELGGQDRVLGEAGRRVRPRGARLETGQPVERALGKALELGSGDPLGGQRRFDFGRARDGQALAFGRGRLLPVKPLPGGALSGEERLRLLAGLALIDGGRLRQQELGLVGTRGRHRRGRDGRGGRGGRVGAELGRVECPGPGAGRIEGVQQPAKLGEDAVAGGRRAVHPADGERVALDVPQGGSAHDDAPPADAVHDPLLGDGPGRRVEGQEVVRAERGGHRPGDQVPLGPAPKLVGRAAVEARVGLVDQDVATVGIENRRRVAVVVDRRQRADGEELGLEVAGFGPGHRQEDRSPPPRAGARGWRLDGRWTPGRAVRTGLGGVAGGRGRAVGSG